MFLHITVAALTGITSLCETGLQLGVFDQNDVAISYVSSKTNILCDC